MKDNNQPTTDSKYIQQHLANERTYLAWVRTSITIIGVGFLITNLHYSSITVNLIIGDTLAQIIGLASILIGIMSLVLATYGYFKKGKDINEQSFIHPKLIVILLTISLLLIFLTFTIYYFFAWELFN